MVKGLVAAVVLFTTLIHPATAAEALPPSEPVLRAELEAASWPADVVRLAADYRARFPNGPLAAEAAARAARAAPAAGALESKDVNLSRSAFAAAAQQPALREDLAKAALADPAAATRIAHAYRDGSVVGMDDDRHLAWLHYAAAIGGDLANYELSRHYRRQAQMPLASKYQARAVELGFVLPPELDAVRK